MQLQAKDGFQCLFFVGGTMKKDIIIKNNSSLTYEKIGYILDNSKDIIKKHLQDVILYQSDDGVEFLFKVNTYSTSNAEVWEFSGVGN